MINPVSWIIAYRSLACIVRSTQGYIKNNAPFSEFRWADFFRRRVLVDKDVLAGKRSLDDFAFIVEEQGRRELTGDGEDVVRITSLMMDTNKHRETQGNAAVYDEPGRPLPRKQDQAQTTSR